MTLHRFTPTPLYNTIGSHAPALTIADGDTVTADTPDAHGFDHRGERSATGPTP